jgi:membrane protein YdbS with pleckstrin-like domain
MQCPACHAELSREAAFCHRCGARLGGDEGQENPNPPTTPRSALERAARQNAAEDDEEVELWAGGYSPKAMIGWALGAGLVSLGLVVSGVFLPTPLTWFVIAGVIVLIWSWLGLVLAYRRLSVSYRLTNQRLVHKCGILRRYSDRIEAIDMDDISYDQGLVERLLDVGTVRIKSSDRTHPDICLRGIDQVHEVAARLDAARRKERIRRGLHVEAI